MTEQLLACPACGASFQPEPNKSNMACPFCGVAINIPAHLRCNKAIETPPATEAPEFDPFAAAHRAVTPEMREKSRKDAQMVSDVIRKVEPVASKAYSAYAWWAIIKNLLVPLGILFFACCCLSMVAGGLLVYFLRGN